MRTVQRGRLAAPIKAGGPAPPSSSVSEVRSAEQVRRAVDRWATSAEARGGRVHTARRVPELGVSRPG